MDTQPWHKFYPNKLTVLLEHPNFMLGCWLRVWCVLSNSKTRWTKEGSLEMWARIVGEKVSDTKKFINYMSLNMSDMKVISSVGPDRRPLYSITEQFYMTLESGKGLRKTGIKTGRKRSSVTVNREVVKKRLIAAYPVHRNSAQPVMFRKEVAEVMCDASRAFTTIGDKVDAENDMCQEILKYIAWSKTTDEWLEQDGQFIPGIGNFMQRRSWETDPRPNAKIERVLKDEIISKIQENMPE